MSNSRPVRPKTAKCYARGDKFSLVAAIDFGTTYSGYAFSFTSKPDDIHMNNSWGAALGATTYKAPTCILTDDSDKLVAFGYEALNRYTKDAGISNIRHFYDRVKMTLYKEKVISSKTTVLSADGRIRPAELIISLILQYLYTHIIDALQKSNVSDVDVKEIRWVLTVPAIWSEGAKQLMRRAACKAGIIDNLASKRLLIALEPESASFWCRTRPLDQFTQRPGFATSHYNYQEGKYMVVDCGGGTIDITVHDKTPSGKVREVHRATGGDWGGTKVDDAFFSLLQRIFSEQYIKIYKAGQPNDWVNLLVQFETAKRSLSTITEGSINIPLTYTFGMAVCAKFGKPPDEVVEDANIPGVSVQQGILIISGDALKQIFSSVIEKILEHLQNLLSKPELDGVLFMYLVGGFSECEILQNAVKEKLGDYICVLVPHDAGMVVMKGAVLYGHKPDVIDTRIAMRTYGDRVAPLFKSGYHDPSKMIKTDGVQRCDKIFGVWIRKNEPVRTGEMRTFRRMAGRQNQITSICEIYASNNESVMYTTEESVNKIGSLTIDIGNTSLPHFERLIDVHVYFGGTELYVQLEDVTQEDGDTAETTIDFLADDA